MCEQGICVELWFCCRSLSQDEAYNDPLSPEDLHFQSFDQMHPTLKCNEGHPTLLDTPEGSDENKPSNIYSGGGDSNVGVDDDGSPVDGSSVEEEKENNSEGSPAPCTPPPLSKKERSDYKASIVGMKSAFSFCTSPAEGRMIDVKELMTGDLHRSRGAEGVDDAVALVSISLYVHVCVCVCRATSRLHVPS